MVSLVYKARENDLITENQAKYLFAQFSTLGYRKSEPVELAVEREEPYLVKKVIDLYKSDLGYSLPDIAVILHLSVKDLESEFNLQPFGLRVTRRS